MLAVRTLRPLPPEGPLTQPALEQLREPGFHVVHAPPGYIMSENVAAVLGEEVAWLRLSRLDMHPAGMAEALSVIAPEAQNALRAARSPAELGSVVMNHLGPTTTVVVENTNGHVSASTSFRLADGAMAAGAARVVVISHSRLHRLPTRARAIGRSALTADGTITSPLIERAVAELGVPAVAEVLRMAAGRAALASDALAAALARDSSATVRTLARHLSRRRFSQELSGALLRTCSASELEALSVATELGYWHPSLGGDADGVELRPWLVPLADDWFWLRPLWRPILRHQLDPPPIPRTSAEHCSPIASNEERVDGAPENPVDSESNERRTRRLSGAPADAARHQLGVRLLGRFEVTLDGTRVEAWEGRIPAAILAFLLTRDHRSASRDRLMDTFWPDVEPKRARNRMHVALSSLRRTIRTVSDVDIVEFHSGRYQFSDELDVQVDVEEFTKTAQMAFAADSGESTEAALEHYRRAVALYAGDFLADTPYEEWTILPRETHRTTYLEVLQRMAARLEQQGREQECVGIGQLMLRQDPCSEPAHRLLIRSYSNLGEHRRALRQFDLCRRTLDHVLGIRPSQETLEALREAKAAYRD